MKAFGSTWFAIPLPILFFIIALLFLTAAPLARGAALVTIDSDFQQQSLGLGLAYRIEGAQRQSPQTAMASGNWVISEQDSLSFGFSTEPRWIRFTVRNLSGSDKNLLLEISNPYLDHIDIYNLDGQGTVLNHIQLGDRLPAAERLIAHAHFLAPLKLAADATNQIMIRVSTTSTNRIPITLWEEQAYISGDYSGTLKKALLYGFLLAISCYHLLLYFSLREKAYLLWSLSIFCMLCVISSQDGVATALLWPGLTWPNDYLILLGICGAVGFSSMFSAEVLNLSERPRLRMIMYLLVVLSLIVGAASFVAPYQLILKVALVLALGNAFSQTLVYLVRMFDGYAPARYVVVAIICACIGVVINILTVSGRIPSSALGANAAAIGAAFAAVFYSLALSNRMNLDRTLREQAQLKLTLDLDSKVKERSIELKQANERLLEASITDSLTGLFNRRHFDEIYDAEYRSAYRKKQPIAVLMMDIDHFKQLNDRYGHTFGDLCLKTVATAITQCLNRPPDICARYGGEEFIVVLPNTDTAGAIHLAEIINRQVANTLVSDDIHNAGITISIGVAASIPGSPENNELLLKEADDYLYRAKNKGRNRVASA